MYVGFRGDLNYAEKEGRNAAWALQRQVRWSSMTCHLFLHATCQNIDVGLARNGNVVHRDWQPADILDILPGVYLPIYIYIFMNMYMYMYMHAYVYTYAYVYVYLYIYMSSDLSTVRWQKRAVTESRD